MLSTDGKRLYVIGDLHGCIDELKRVQGEIAADLARRPHGNAVIICIGDYTDRGPDSRGVLETLIKARDSAQQYRFLFGNHDQRFLAYLDDPNEMSTESLHWLDPALGGDKTLASYGIADGTRSTAKASYEAFKKAVPDAHIAFLREAEPMIQIGSYVLVHAGIRPGAPLDQQDLEDLIWIRKPFLNSTEDFGFVVVHGHTPVKRIENHGNRIAVDTGAVFGRHLSCLVLEGAEQSQLVGENLLACKPEVRP